MDTPDITLLIDMGFDRSRIEKALHVTGNQGVEPAMEWLLAHADELDGEASSGNQMSSASMEKPNDAKTEVTNEESSSVEPPPEAKSLQCNECNKLFKTQLDVEYHAAKTGHSNFSESTEEKKPLTEEERQEQMRLLEVKMKEKRKEREEKEKQEELDREKNRIRAGKEIAAARKKLEDDEMKKILDQRRREKEEDRLARQRVKDQIEADKLARKAKLAGEPVEVIEKPAQPSVLQPSVPKDYTQTKLQIRLTNGNALTQTFSAKEQLSAVRLFVEMNRTDGNGPFNFMTNFPKKVFSIEDYEKPLDVLGLVPSAVLIVVKAHFQ